MSNCSTTSCVFDFLVAVSFFPVFSCIFPELSRLFSPYIRQQFPRISVWFGNQIIRWFTYHIIQPLSGVDTTFLTWAKQGADYSRILSHLPYNLRIYIFLWSQLRFVCYFLAYQKVINQLYQKMLLLNLLITLCAFRGKWISSVIKNNIAFL